MSTIGVRFGTIWVVDKLCACCLNCERARFHAVLSLEPLAGSVLITRFRGI